MFDINSAAPEELAVCWYCIGEPYLKEVVSKDGEVRECDYCKKTAKTFSLDELSEIVEAAFNAHYSVTARDPDGYQIAAMKDTENDYQWNREGEPTAIAILNALDASEDIANDIQKVLAEKHYDFDDLESPFSEETHYEEIMPGDSDWQESWHEFERVLKTEARFFNSEGAARLTSLFGNIEGLKTWAGSPLIVDAGPEALLTQLYRARVFQSDSKLADALKRPDRELAAPPSPIAATGRMNAKGISTFYGATDAKTALSEVRPPVGSQVAVACFDVVRPLRLLDLTALKNIHLNGSIFDPDYASELGRMMFLRSLSDRMSRAVMPDDQDVEYLPTQAIADYLATEGTVKLDGIMFPSAQSGSTGLNVVLFHKASRCEEIAIPKGTEISARTGSQTEDGWERDYTVIEETPAETDPSEKNSSEAMDFDPGEFLNWEAIRSADYRQTTLRIDLKSVRVNLVNAVVVDTTEYEVMRYRWSKNAYDF